MDNFRRQIMASTLALGCGAFAGRVFGQEVWPSKPIRVISPGAPGGGSDIFIRIVEPRLRERLGQGLFIENHPGAGGMTGAAVANTARPDGYTFFVSNVATNGIGVSLYRKPTFDPKKDLPPLVNGDHLDQKTFHERYEAMPEVRAELIGGIVYMSSPQKMRHEAMPDVRAELIGGIVLNRRNNRPRQFASHL